VHKGKGYNQQCKQTADASTEGAYTIIANQELTFHRFRVSHADLNSFIFKLS
jgi:hypothetical protein